MRVRAFERVMLAVTSPRLALRVWRTGRALRREASAERVLAALSLAQRLDLSVVEPRNHDPVDETLRLVRRIRQAHAARLHRAVAGVYAGLGDEARGGVRERAKPVLGGLVSVLARDSEPGSRLSGAELARDAGEPALIPAVVGLISDADEGVSKAARGAVLALARVLAAVRMGEHAVRASEAEAIAAVLRAAEGYPEHRSGEVMEAAVLLLDPAVRRGLVGTELSRWLRGADEAVRMGLRGALKRAPGEAGRVRAWELLTEPEFRQSAVERLCAPGAREEIHAVLAEAHLGLRGARRVPMRARVSRVERPRLFPDLEAIEKAPLAARRGIGLWLDAVQPEDDRVEALLEPMLADPDDAARLSVVRRAPAGILRDLSLDPCEAVARSAALRLLHTGAMTDAHQTMLARSIHPGVRMVAEDRAGRTSGVVPAMRRLAESRDEVVASLRAQLAGDEERGVVEAVRVIRRLGLAEELAPDLIRALERAFRRDDSPAWRVISAVLTAVPELPHPQVARMLAAARAHNDARVRATAVEAEARRPRGRASSMVEVLEPALGDTNHRVRTSALRVLLREKAAPADAVDRVLETLASPEPAARAAALWLVERSLVELRPVAGRRWTDLAAKVAELAREGAELSERSRATRTARRMLAEIKG